MARDIVILMDAKNQHWLHFRQPVDIVQVETVEAVLPALQWIETKIEREGLWAAGLIGYEASGAFDPALQTLTGARFPLLWFGLYREPEPIELPETTDGGFMLGEWTPSVSPGEYDQAIAQIKEHIASGDTYQVNYTLRLRAAFSGNPWALFLQLARTQQAQYAAYVDLGDYAVCSASPELFFNWENGRLVSKPMKGTAARGRLLEDDRRQAEWLHTSEKNRAENVMIVDMIRNDLGRIARVGSVRVPRLFQVERYPTVWQMTSTVEAESEAGLVEILTALFPCASITGAPKVRTMHIIADLETAPRQVYTGCIGFVTPQRRAQFNVAIRTVLVDCTRGEAEYGVGGGIVWDSTPAEEYEECRIKARLLTQPRPIFSLMESMLWTPGDSYFLQDQHIRRLVDSCEYFGFPIDAEAVKSALDGLAARLTAEPHKVRVVLDRNGKIDCQAQALASIPLPDPARVRLAQHPVSSENVFLYHKTTHRIAYTQARRGLPPDEEPLLWNERGEITESENANIVARLDGRLVTPPVSCGLLPGVFRQQLLETGEVVEAVLHRADLPHCEEIWLVNSVRKWRKAVIIR